MRNHASPFWRKKHDSLRHSNTGFRENVLVAEDTLPNVISVIILPSKEMSTNFSGEKKKLTMKL